MRNPNVVENYTCFYNKIKKRQDDRREIDLITKIDHYNSISKEYSRTIKGNIDAKKSKKSRNNNFIKETNNPTSRIIKSMGENIAEYDNIRESLKEPFQLYVMGSGKYGKSTVINCLIGNNIKYAPEGITPKTWKVDLFKNDISDDVAIIKRSDGKSKKHTKKEAETIIEQEEQKMNNNREDIKNKLNKFISQQSIRPAPEIIKEYKQNLTSEMMEYSDITEVVWGVKDSKLLQNFTIVDTPGLFQLNSSGEVEKSALDYYHKADGVIWLLDATTIDSSNPEEMLKDIDNSIIGMNRNNKNKSSENMIGLINKIDLIHGEQNKNEVINKANETFGKRFNQIIPYSAKQAALGIEEINETLLEESGHNKLLEVIKLTFFNNAKKIQCDKKETANLKITEKAERELITYQNQLRKDVRELNRRTDSVEDKFEREVNNIMAKINKEINVYLRNFSRGLDVKISKLYKIEDEYSKNKYIREDIFKIENLEKSIAKIVTENWRNFDKIRGDSIRDYYFTQYKHLNKFQNMQVNKIKTSRASVGYRDLWIPDTGNSMLVSSGIGAALLGPLGLLVGAGAGFLFSIYKKDKVITEFKNQAQEVTIRLKNDYYKEINSNSKLVLDDTVHHINESISNLYNLKISTYSSNNVKTRINNILRITLLAIDKINIAYYKRFTPTVTELITNKGE